MAADWALPNRFVDVIGCALPVQQAGMGGVTTPALAAAVASAGGLGMLAGAGRSAEDIAADLAQASVLTVGERGRIGVNFLMPFLDGRALDRAASNATLVECFYGDPDRKVVDRIHDGDALAAWQVGSVDEAARAVDAGCDLLVVQGREAGGHVRGVEPLLSLVTAVAARVDLTIVAAGGIGSGTAMAAAIDAGADAVRIGTRFLAATEADVHPSYLDALIRADADDTELTDAFSAGWPDAPHRVLRSAVAASTADKLTRSVSPPTRGFRGDVTSAALYAGTSVAHVARAEAAADIVDELVRDAIQALRSSDAAQ